MPLCLREIDELYRSDATPPPPQVPPTFCPSLHELSTVKDDALAVATRLLELGFPDYLADVVKVRVDGEQLMSVSNRELENDPSWWQHILNALNKKWKPIENTLDDSVDGFEEEATLGARTASFPTTDNAERREQKARQRILDLKMTRFLQDVPQTRTSPTGPPKRNWSDDCPAEQNEQKPVTTRKRRKIHEPPPRRCFVVRDQTAVDDKASPFGPAMIGTTARKREDSPADFKPLERLGAKRSFRNKKSAGSASFARSVQTFSNDSDRHKLGASDTLATSAWHPQVPKRRSRRLNGQAPDPKQGSTYYVKD